MESRHQKEHALAVLKRFDELEWPNTKRVQESGREGGAFEAITAKFLYFLVEESQQFTDSRVLDQFWTQLGACDEKLGENCKSKFECDRHYFCPSVESLLQEDFVSQKRSFEVLFQGLKPEEIDFKPVLKMAEEYFSLTIANMAVMNPGGRKSMPGTAYSVSEFISKETKELVWTAEGGDSLGKRKASLKALSFRRDGHTSLFTGSRFKPHYRDGIIPETAHIIPNSVDGKPDILGCIAMFAGTSARDAIIKHLNSIGNIANMDHDLHVAYDDLLWGIEAKEERGQVKYIFRTVNSPPHTAALKDGDEIRFGEVVGSEDIEKPIPILCNLQLAVARVMHMSAAADIVLKWMDDADDEGCCPLFFTPGEFCTILDAKLSLSGGTAIV